MVESSEKLLILEPVSLCIEWKLAARAGDISIVGAASYSMGTGITGLLRVSN